MSRDRTPARGSRAANSPWKQGLIHLAMAIISVCVGLAAVEALVRVFGLAPALPEEYQGFIDDPFLPFRGQPFYTRRGTSPSGEFEFEYTTNSQGFRDREHSFEKPHAVFRILTLGDSFTWGVGAPPDRSFPSRLEQLLNARGSGHPTVEVINLGMIRYFPKIERIALEQYGVRYEPDLVLVAFVANDVRDTAMGLDALRSSREGYLMSRRSQRLGRFGVWMYIHSQAARALISRYMASSELGLPEARAQAFTRVEMERAWLEIEQEFARMGEIARAHGAKLAAVHIPLAQLVPNLHGRLAQGVEGSVDAVIDTTPQLGAARLRTGRYLYWPVDGHCDAHGYEVIARTLARELTRSGLVP